MFWSMESVFVLILLLSAAVSSFVAADDEAFIGVNIGTDLSDMPHPTQVVALLKAQQIWHVRLYDADRGMLVALANTGIQVMVSVPNEQLLGIGQSNSTAANWVSHNIVAHYPATNITAICVGSEVFTAVPNAASVLVNAMKFIQSALVASNLDRQIKVSTPLSSSIILDSFPPSQAFFNKTWNPVLIPMVNFLQSTGSHLMLNIYPYYDYMQSNGVIPLDYALLKPLAPNKEAVDANTLVHYSNVFDAMIDAAYFAMDFLNFTNVPVMVTESGWPSKGDSNEPDATLDNANTYNSNLIRHVLNKTGTPKHPGIAVSTYIYELYNEDLKPGPVSEKNWGLFNANGEPVYILHLTGSGLVLANDTTNQTYCTAKQGADPKMLQAALDWACGPGKVDCSAMLQGEPCYQPDNVIAHATYAFNSYYNQMGKAPGTCDFNGVAAITTTNPSHGTCVFPGSTGRMNGTTVNITAPSMNSTSSAPSVRDLYNLGSTSFLVLLRVLICSIVFL
ncbi:PREDICTED: glucan endo-1,3-beta-glucosidase 2-like isoform X2 [Populus euphratica]|uniref:glucan endo-1,3-beta-D-glucosidase n=1 Tax=Populus euphratica TaxID=75702 RepID=A0AAJ6TAI5_POPEU|nr:PREDICTED: glucan endo-1,3-beta-glucosidase 2-like isoform X1 [Populus euphratica]XP_011007239.1 PREDICTED: glucan endo-1,3-beta-glucosidase 2-like isoform X2 [Populus euphratica]